MSDNSMKILDILTEEVKSTKTPDGTYVAVKYDDKSLDALVKLCKDLKIPDALTRDKFHTTLIYSKKYDASVKANPDFCGTAKVRKFHIFKTATGANALVLTLDSPQLVARHKEYMKNHDLVYDFDKYIPHITLSYDVGDFDTNIEYNFPELNYCDEYSEDLNLDWVEKD